MASSLSSELKMRALAPALGLSAGHVAPPLLKVSAKMTATSSAVLISPVAAACNARDGVIEEGRESKLPTEASDRGWGVILIRVKRGCSPR